MPRALVAVALLCTTVSIAHATGDVDAAWQRFFESSGEAAVGSLDLLAPRTPTLDLPLAARAIDRFEASRDTIVPGAYLAFARWHFWMGEHWDRGDRGLWGGDPLWSPRGVDPSLRASAALNAWQLVQLEALASLALRRDDVYDALVWWSERRRLRNRMGRELYDAQLGAYCDLDSSGTRTPAPFVEALLPVACGAPRLTARSLDYQTRSWAELDTHLDSLLAPTTKAGFLTAPRRAALSLANCRSLYHRQLERRLSQSLGLRGVDVEEPLRVAASISPLELDSTDLLPRPEDAVRRALTAVEFLHRGGFVSRNSHADLSARLDSLRRAHATLDDETMDRLTNALVEWRTSARQDLRGTWNSRRAGQRPPDPEGSRFHLRDEDAVHWIDRALDLLAEVVVEHALRDRPTSPTRAEFVDELRGRGDTATLRLTLPLESRERVPTSIGVMWTDGLQVLPPLQLDLQSTDDGFVAEVPAVPDANGIWRAIVSGLDPAPRVAPTLAVIDPVRATVVPMGPTRNEHPHRIQLKSQVTYPIRGSFEVEAPLQWTVDPAARVPYALGPGETRILEVRLHPDAEAAPGSYPVTWHFYDGHSEISQQLTLAVRPFRWVHIGPFPSAKTDFDWVRKLLPLDFSRAVRGPQGPLRWHRLSGGNFGPGGELQFAPTVAGWHYALTAFTTGSDRARLRVRSRTPWILYFNSREVARSGEDTSAGIEVDLRQGANRVLVGTWQPEGETVPCGVDISSVDGSPLAGADDTLEMTLEGYAYLEGEGKKAPENFARETLRLIPLTYTNPDATEVSVVGSFNGWSPDRTPMTRDDDGRWVAGIRVPPGRFEYKFAVDGSDWIPDPANPNQAPDGFGGQNSVLVVD